MSAFDSTPPLATDAAPASRALPEKRLRATLAAAIAVAVALAIGVAVWTGRAADAHPSTTPATAAIVARLDRIHDSFPASPAEQTCTKRVAGNVPLVDFDVLASFRDGQADGRSAGLDVSSVTLSAEWRSPFGTPASDASLTRVGGAEHVAVLRTSSVTAPRPSVGAPEPGRYEGWLVVFDARSAVAVCQTRVVAWSSRYATEPGIGETAMKVDFVDRIRSSVRDRAERLSTELVLDL